MSHTAFCIVGTPAPVPVQRPQRQKGARNFLPPKIPRNPLKRLDSDERIQGNPRKSKPCFRAVRGKTAMAQENPNRSSKRAARAANKADAPIPSNREALRRDDGPDPLRLAQSRYISPSACPAVTGRGLPSSSMATKVKVASVTFSRSCVRRRRAHASTWTFIEVRPTPSMAV
jgi:hypothetical protein